MSFVSFFVTFATSWWLILFMLLPVGVKQPEKVEKGHASSAPSNPRILTKMLWATVLAAIFTYLFLTALDHGLFDFISMKETLSPQ